MRSSFLFALVSVSAMTAPACFDTHEELDAFIDRSEPLRVAPTAGECFGPVDLTGDYLLSVAVTLGPDKPIRLAATFTVDITTTPWSLSVKAKTLTVADGTPIGDEIMATSPIADDGSFSLDFGTVTVLAEANPIVEGLTVKATLVLDGCTSTATFACGIANGAITDPVASPIDGSSWGLVIVPEGGNPGALTLVAACPAE